MIRSNRFRPLLAAAPALLLLLVPVALAAQGEGEVEGTGFLSDYSMLAPDPEGVSEFIYHNPDYSRATVTGLLIPDLVFHFHPTEEGRTVSAEKAAKMVELAQRFSNTWREALAEEGVNLVDEPGPGIARCRVAITNLGRTKSVARIVPQARATGAGRGGAAMEAECSDSVTGEVISQVINSDKGRRKSGVTTWAGAESAIRKWAALIAGRLEDTGLPAVSR